MVGWLCAAAGVGFGEPEVEHCYDAVGSHLDIHRLEVAVDDTGVVRRREGFGDLFPNG